MALTQITEKGIKDGEIVNADINASADIALSKLDTSGTANNGTFLRGDGAWTAVTSTTINNNDDNKVITATGTANTLQGEPYIFASGASLSIGTNSPAYSANFHIRNSYASMRIDSDGSNNHTDFFNVTGTGKENRIHFGDAADTDVGGIIYDHSNDSLRFNVNADERMRINSSGNVGIGETAPGDNRIRSTSPHAYNVVAKSTNGNGGYHNFTGVNSSSAITSYITHNGRVGASDGIIFGSDTAAANVLDDYEEGTWTPTFNNAGGFNTNNTVAKYTKIGRVVHWVCQVAVQRNGSSSSGTFTIGGLPFTALNQATGGHGYAGCMGALYKWDIPSNAYQIGIRVPDNTTFIQFFANFDNAADAQLTSPFPANQTIFGSLSGTYIT